MLISLAELITFVALAAHQAPRWEFRLVVYFGDNTNVVGWLLSRTTNNRFARFMLRVLVQMELVHNFQTLAVYIRSANNEFADDLTRLPLPEARRLLAT